MITSLLNTLKARLETRRTYNKALAEIAALDERELIDLRADRTEMQRALYRQVYG